MHLPENTKVFDKLRVPSLRHGLCECADITPVGIHECFAIEAESPCEALPHPQHDLRDLIAEQFILLKAR